MRSTAASGGQLAPGANAARTAEVNSVGVWWAAMLANVLQERVKPDGLAIVMEADHFCMQWRGVKDLDSAMTNSVMRGAFLKDPHLRREFLSLLSKKNA